MVIETDHWKRRQRVFDAWVTDKRRYQELSVIIDEWCRNHPIDSGASDEALRAYFDQAYNYAIKEKDGGFGNKETPQQQHKPKKSNKWTTSKEQRDVWLASHPRYPEIREVMERLIKETKIPVKDNIIDSWNYFYDVACKIVDDMKHPEDANKPKKIKEELTTQTYAEFFKAQTGLPGPHLYPTNWMLDQIELVKNQMNQDTKYQMYQDQMLAWMRENPPLWRVRIGSAGQVKAYIDEAYEIVIERVKQEVQAADLARASSPQREVPFSPQREVPFWPKKRVWWLDPSLAVAFIPFILLLIAACHQR